MGFVGYWELIVTFVVGAAFAVAAGWRPGKAPRSKVRSILVKFENKDKTDNE